jgi:hypothetical protein
MSEFTVEKPRLEEHRVGDVALVRQAVQAKHYPSYANADYEVMPSGVLRISDNKGVEYLSPIQWVRVYSGPPRKVDES